MVKLETNAHYSNVVTKATVQILEKELSKLQKLVMKRRSDMRSGRKPLDRNEEGGVFLNVYTHGLDSYQTELCRKIASVLDDPVFIDNMDIKTEEVDIGTVITGKTATIGPGSVDDQGDISIAVLGEWDALYLDLDDVEICSIDSDMGKELLGSRKGDIVTVETPRTKQIIQILEIKKYTDYLEEISSQCRP